MTRIKEIGLLFVCVTIPNVSFAMNETFPENPNISNHPLNFQNFSTVQDDTQQHSLNQSSEKPTKNYRTLAYIFESFGINVSEMKEYQGNKHYRRKFEDKILRQTLRNMTNNKNGNQNPKRNCKMEKFLVKKLEFKTTRVHYLTIDYIDQTYLGDIQKQLAIMIGAQMPEIK